MEDFKVLIKVEQYLWHKELILKLLSEKLQTHKVEVRCMYNSFEEIFKNYLNLTQINFGKIANYDAVIVDKKETFIIEKAKEQNVKLRIIK